MLILATGNQVASKTSRVILGATSGLGTGPGAVALCMASWESNAQGEMFDTTNFESYNATFNPAFPNTYDEGVIGKIWSDLSFGGSWDASFSPYNVIPGVVPRDNLAGLCLLNDRLTGAPGWYFPYSRIMQARNGGEISGLVTFQASGKNQGPFTFPA
jgi:hypothetical protein